MIRSHTWLETRNHAKVLLAAAAAAMVLAACSSSGTSSGTSSAGGGSSSSAAAAAGGLKTANIGGVAVLTNAKGFTLYSFAPDTPTTSKCNGTCAQNWPPVTGPSRASGFAHERSRCTCDGSDRNSAACVAMNANRGFPPNSRCQCVSA